MSRLHFICRVKGGTERQTLVEAAKRAHRVWLPFALESTRRRGKSAAVATVRPIMPYLFCEAGHAEMAQLLKYRDVFSTVWFVPERQRRLIRAYQGEVEARFEENRLAYLTDARAFHCTFKEGQSVKLRQKGMDLMDAWFVGICEDGRYELEAEMFGSRVQIKAEPHHVGVKQ